MVPPRVAEILRALKGLPPGEASALLRTVLVGLDEVERQSVRQLLPAQSRELGQQALTLLADPNELPTLMQALPMPWEPSADAELVPPGPAAPPAPIPLTVPAPPPTDSTPDPELELKRIMKRSRMIIAAAIAAVVLILSGAAAVVLTRGGDEVAATPQPQPAPKKRTRPHPPPVVEEDDPLPSLPASHKAQAARPAPAPAARPAAAPAPAPKGGFDEWPGDKAKKQRSVAAATKAADEAFEDDDLKKMRNER